MEEDGGLNLYAFCSNNGVNSWDYLGNYANTPSYADAGAGALFLPTEATGVATLTAGAAFALNASGLVHDSLADAMRAVTDAQHDAEQAANDKAKVDGVNQKLAAGQPVTVTGADGKSVTYQPGQQIAVDSNGTVGVVAPNSATTGAFGGGFPAVTSEAFIKDKYILTMCHGGVQPRRGTDIRVRLPLLHESQNDV